MQNRGTGGRNTRSKSPAAERVLDVLGYISTRHAPVGAQSVATALGLPRSTVYQLLDVLVERGYLSHFPEERTYGLGLSAFELSMAFARQEPVARVVGPVLERLVDRVGETGHVAVLRGNEAVYINAVRARFRPSLVTAVGVRLPAHLTASGRALLGALPEAQVRALYPGGTGLLRRVEGHGPRSLRELRTVLAADRARGYALEQGEVTAEFDSLSVAARDRNGLPQVALTITFLGHRYDTAGRDEIARHIAASAREVERRLG